MNGQRSEPSGGATISLAPALSRKREAMDAGHLHKHDLPWTRARARAAPAEHPEPEERAGRPSEAKRSAPRWLAWAGGLALIVAVVVAVVLAHQRSVAARALPDGLVQVNGRIEGDDVTLATKVPGRVRSLLAREGDVVRAGQIVAKLEDDAARARLEQALSSRDVAVAKLLAAVTELELLRKQVPIAVDSASAALRASEASLEEAHAGELQAERERARVAALFASGSLDVQTNERAVLAHDTAAQSVLAARGARDKAAAAVRDARLGPDQIRAKEAEATALEAASHQAQALVDEAATALDDLTLVAPVDGTVTTRFMDVGQVLSGGAPVVEVVDLDKLYLKAFVPESDVGKVRLGAPARVYIDAFPGAPAAATVHYIASRAEFTPKEVQTRDERVKLVYTIKLYIDDNRDRRLVPGLGADAVVRWREDVPWTAPR